MTPVNSPLPLLHQHSRCLLGVAVCLCLSAHPLVCLLAAIVPVEGPLEAVEPLVAPVAVAPVAVAPVAVDPALAPAVLAPAIVPVEVAPVVAPAVSPVAPLAVAPVVAPAVAPVAPVAAVPLLPLAPGAVSPDMAPAPGVCCVLHARAP